MSFKSGAEQGYYATRAAAAAREATRRHNQWVAEQQHQNELDNNTTSLDEIGEVVCYTGQDTAGGHIEPKLTTVLSRCTVSKNFLRAALFVVILIILILLILA